MDDGFKGCQVVLVSGPSSSYGDNARVDVFFKLFTSENRDLNTSLFVFHCGGVTYNDTRLNPKRYLRLYRWKRVSRDLCLKENRHDAICERGRHD